MHTWFVEVKLALTPFKDGPKYFETWLQARNAARDYVAEVINSKTRAEKAKECADVLGISAWHEDRAAHAAEQQEQALGGVIAGGRIVKVERRQRV
jgi:hypothetical protein